MSSVLFGTKQHSPAYHAYQAAQIIAGVWVLGTVTAGRAAWVGADELAQAVRRELAKVGGS